jgi:hypothetical protein
MALPSSAPITLSAIQSETGTANLAAASSAAGLHPLPTSMLDFLGWTSAAAYLDPGGTNLISTYNDQGISFVQAFIQVEFLTDGRLRLTQGNNSEIASPFINGGQWLTTSPGTVSQAVAQGWDIELVKVSGPADGVDDSYLPNGGYRSINSQGTNWSTRIQLGNYDVGRYLLITVSGSGNPVYWDETLIFNANIYLHGTNTLVASSTFNLYVEASTLAEA